MKLRTLLPCVAFGLSFVAQEASAARREPRSPETSIRVLADAKAEQPSPAPRALQAAVGAPATEPAWDDGLRRELLERSSLLNARFDELDAKIYEIVGRLQLLAGCLIAMFLGMAAWQVSIARQIARLKGARQIEQSGGLR